jgi:hypothetical protein
VFWLIERVVFWLLVLVFVGLGAIIWIRGAA